MTYTQLEKQGIMLPLAELSCRYFRPVHYEDEVIIITDTLKVSAAKIVFGYRVMLDGVLMAQGSTTHGFVSSQSFRPVNLKKLMPDFYEKLRASVIEG